MANDEWIDSTDKRYETEEWSKISKSTISEVAATYLESMDRIETMRIHGIGGSDEQRRRRAKYLFRRKDLLSHIGVSASMEEESGQDIARRAMRGVMDIAINAESDETRLKAWSKIMDVGLKLMDQQRETEREVSGDADIVRLIEQHIKSASTK